jgi:hypothetical protein
MMRRIVVPILFLLLLVSCREEEHPQSRPILPQKRPITNFTPEITLMKTVGEIMITRLDGEVYPGFELTEYLPPASPGSKWECRLSVYIDGDWCYRCSTVGSGIPTFPDYPTRDYDLAINKSGGIIGVIEKGNGSLTRSQKVIGGKLRPVEILSEGLYKQELIYNGKSKDTIRLSYREYIKDMARPAFFQDLTYDLLESREIAFRDLQIEVLEATNSTIKFFVKK